jgi:outer membrane protein assembly factor BamE (lipoprotein component of BamABCDE complex)
MKPQITFASFLAVVFLAAVSPRQAWAQAPTVDQLVTRVAELERRVAELEQRLRALEVPEVTARPENRAVRGNSEDIANWRQLRVGMTMEQVSNLLGEPDRVVVIGLTTWHYPNRAHVMFNPQSRVSGWEERHR